MIFHRETPWSVVRASLHRDCSIPTSAKADSTSISCAGEPLYSPHVKSPIAGALLRRLRCSHGVAGSWRSNLTVRTNLAELPPDCPSPASYPQAARQQCSSSTSFLVHDYHDSTQGTEVHTRPKSVSEWQRNRDRKSGPLPLEIHAIIFDWAARSLLF